MDINLEQLEEFFIAATFSSWQPYWRYQKGKGKFGKQYELDQESEKQDMNFGNLQKSAEEQYEQNGEWTVHFHLNLLENLGEHDACCNNMEDRLLSTEQRQAGWTLMQSQEQEEQRYHIMEKEMLHFKFGVLTVHLLTLKFVESKDLYWRIELVRHSCTL